MFDLDYTPDNFGAITERLQSTLRNRSALEVYDYFLKEKADLRWVIQDGYFEPGNADLLRGDMYPEYYRFAWRMDELFSMTDAAPIILLGRLTGMSILSLDHLVKAMNDSIDSLREGPRGWRSVFP